MQNCVSKFQVRIKMGSNLNHPYIRVMIYILNINYMQSTLLTIYLNGKMTMLILNHFDLLSQLFVAKLEVNISKAYKQKASNKSSCYQIEYYQIELGQ